MKTMEELLMVAVDRDSDGERMPENCYYVGSGSIFAYGVLDAGYRYDLTDEEAYNLGSRATVCEVISVQTCKKPREVEKMKKDKSTSDNKLAIVFAWAISAKKPRSSSGIVFIEVHTLDCNFSISERQHRILNESLEGSCLLQASRLLDILSLKEIKITLHSVHDLSIFVLG